MDEYQSSAVVYRHATPSDCIAKKVHVRFEHGLGDCVYFAHQLPLYKRRGWEIVVSCSPDKNILFHAAGVEVAASPHTGVNVPWFEGEQPTSDLRFDNYWRWSKMARNLSLEPMPDIGHPASLWGEFCDETLDAEPFIGKAARDSVTGYLKNLARPLVLLHSHGVTDPERKNIPATALRQILRELLAGTESTILLLDWDCNVPPYPHWRIRHVQYDFGHLNTAQLLYLIGKADLLIGIDSGPLHLARLTSTPTIGVWLANGSPPTWTLPRRRQANIVVGTDSRHWTRHARVPFNILECDELQQLPPLLGRSAGRMLQGARYLRSTDLGRDVLLQQFVRDWQGSGDSSFGGFQDRSAGFDLLFRMAARRFAHPFMVETGCIRREEDFAGAGFSTLLLGMFAADRDGQLISIDRERKHCDLARQTVASLHAAVEVVESDSVEWLSQNRRTIDVLYLDSLDSDEAGCAGHALLEIQAAHPQLAQHSIVVFDDTAYANGGFIGSGALGVAWLRSHDWQILHSGHQTMLTRSGV